MGENNNPKSESRDSKKDKFVCKACESTTVIRPKTAQDEDAPVCASCSEGTGGETEMTWVGTVE